MHCFLTVELTMVWWYQSVNDYCTLNLEASTQLCGVITVLPEFHTLSISY